MTQATIQSGDSFEEYRVSETKEVDFDVDFDRVANPDLIRNSTFNKKLQPVQPARNLRSSFDGEAVTGSTLGDRHTASPSDHVLEAVQSFWKKLRN